MITVKYISKPARTASSSIGDAFLSSTMVAWRSSLRPHIFRPPTDQYETEQALIVRVEIGGMNEDDFNIVLSQNLLLIHGVRADVEEKKAFLQMEIPFGEFSTEVEFTIPVDLDRAEAQYDNGILWITLPKASPHQVKVNKE